MIAAPDEAEETAGTPGRGRRRWVLLAVLVAILVWGAASAWSVAMAAGDLREARDLLEDAEDELRDADLSEARTVLDAGASRAADGARRLHRPHLWPVRVLPVAGPNLRAATALADAARDVGGAASDLLAAADAIVHDDREAVPGEIAIADLEALAPVLRTLADTLERTTTAVVETDSASLVGPVERARDRYLELTAGATEQAVIGADLAEVMPAFLGADRPRRYLLGAGALSELRGAGGLMGSWALLVADEGHLEIGEFHDVDDLTSAAQDVAAPDEEFAARWAELGGMRHWRSANLTPHFPWAAQVMLSLWEAQGDPPLDGVVMTDTVTFARLADRADGLEVPGHGELEADDTLEFVGVDAYATFDDDELRKRVLGGVAAAAFQEALAILEDDDVPATVEMLADLAGGGHLQVYSTDPEVQRVLVGAGVAGALPARAGELAGVFVNNVAANKVDWFTTRELVHDVRLVPDGATEATVEATFDNEAPREGYPRAVLGPWTDHTEAGDNLSLVQVVCSTSCTFDDLPDEMRDGGVEHGLPSADVTLRVPAQAERRVRVRTRSEDAWRIEDGRLLVRVAHLVQPTVHGTDLRVQVHVPEGWEADQLPDGAELDDGVVVWEVDDASGPVELELDFVRPDA